MSRFLMIFFVLFSIAVSAQTSEKYNSVYAGYYRAEELFQKQQYGSARKEFRDFIDKNQQQTILSM